jgi:hypothetical protein
MITLVYLKVEVGTSRVTTTWGTSNTTRLTNGLACLNSVSYLDTDIGKVTIAGGDTIGTSYLYHITIAIRVRVRCIDDVTTDS